MRTDLSQFKRNLSHRFGEFGLTNPVASGLVDDSISAISQLIRENGLMPGDRLPSEASLAKDLQVSRTVVREAFRSLAAMRIIELSGGKRAAVAQIDHGAVSLMIEHGIYSDQINIQQIYDVRRTLECRIADLAAIRRSDDEAARIVAIADAMRASAEDPGALMEHDIAFHLALARASRNPVYALLIAAFQGVIRHTWPMGWKSRTTQASRELMLRTHAEIAGAVAAGDPGRAGAAMTLHFDESVRALLAAGMS